MRWSMSQKYELHEEMYKEGGWIEMMDGDLARQQEEKFLDFAEQREVEEKIMEIGEMRDEMGNFIVGELPQVVGDQLTWPTCPTKQQLETPIGESLKEFVRTRGEEFARRVEEEAGGGVVTQGHLFKVTQEWGTHHCWSGGREEERSYLWPERRRKKRDRMCPWDPWSWPWKS